VSSVHLISHPLVQHKLTILRDKDTGPKDFRDLLEEVSMLMAYEVTRDMPLEDMEVETPMDRVKGKVIAGRQVGVVPILRAGLGMVGGVLKLIPTAKVGHIGVYRDPETLRPVEYYCKLPVDVEERQVILLDPMLATGGSAVAAIEYLKEKDVSSIKFMCLLAAPEGIELMQKEHPDVEIFTAAIDERLNEHGYIIPGLGDAGDRLFGTK
jgi:uracil phosphoribosyltransferase